MELVKISDLKKARKFALDKKISSIKKNKDKALSQAEEINDWLKVYKEEMGKPFTAGAKRDEYISHRLLEEELAKENLPISGLSGRIRFDPFSIGFDIFYPEFEGKSKESTYVNLSFDGSKAKVCATPFYFYDDVNYACIDPDGNVTETRSYADYMKKNKWNKKSIKRELGNAKIYEEKAKRMLCFFDPSLENCAPNSTIGEINQADEDWIAYVDIFYKDIIPSLNDRFKKVTRENLDLLSS